MRSNGQNVNRPPSLGLEDHRQSSGISLEQIADSTKISKRFLSAIEKGEYGDLPGGVFTTSYIRQYADAIDFDAAMILAHHRRSTEPEPEPRQHERAAETRPEASIGFVKWASRLLSIT